MTGDDDLAMEPAGEHAFLIRLSQGGDVTELVLHLDAGTLAAVAPDAIDERRRAERRRIERVSTDL